MDFWFFGAAGVVLIAVGLWRGVPVVRRVSLARRLRSQGHRVEGLVEWVSSVGRNDHGVCSREFLMSFPLAEGGMKRLTYTKPTGSLHPRPGRTVEVRYPPGDPGAAVVVGTEGAATRPPVRRVTSAAALFLIGTGLLVLTVFLPEVREGWLTGLLGPGDAWPDGLLTLAAVVAVAPLIAFAATVSHLAQGFHEWWDHAVGRRTRGVVTEIWPEQVSETRQVQPLWSRRGQTSIRTVEYTAQRFAVRFTTKKGRVVQETCAHLSVGDGVLLGQEVGLRYRRRDPTRFHVAEALSYSPGHELAVLLVLRFWPLWTLILIAAYLIWWT
ncbi:hypothetical protein CLV63_10463 [Murinocardiopsis flavida]|uniref:DUF3592 domain-containing protein n=1 Tax=Murinocardiopsis flavida TaxID=645275 RepID=A0A2P8DNR7_9ACTN|nr:DUF3592 domain-containing protein [Murinocardiopsis flavida]PSK98839.1 hypothetical protein CLV63_10463 [Murinocardiopsis flavida]